MSVTYSLWENKVPGKETSTPRITYYKPILKASDAAIIVFPGGGYGGRATHEGKGYALYLNSIGITAFVVDYRVAPSVFPDELLDARRAVRFVRHHADEFGIRKDRIAVMGSSAGGHLASFVSTYLDPIDGEDLDDVDQEDFLPDLQILCYPVIASDESISHAGSFHNLLGDRYSEKEKFSTDLLVSDKTPRAFIWHTSNDGCVNVINSYRFATALRMHNIPCEMHIFPDAPHGVGLCPDRPHVAQWTGLLKNFLISVGYITPISMA